MRKHPGCCFALSAAGPWESLSKRSMTSAPVSVAHESTEGPLRGTKLSINYPGLDPEKVKDAVAALLKYTGASTSAEKILFQEEEMIFLVLSS